MVRSTARKIKSAACRSRISPPCILRPEPKISGTCIARCRRPRTPGGPTARRLRSRGLPHSLGRVVDSINHPLVRAQRVVETRLRRLEQKLNDELGYRDQRLLFKKRSMRQGPTTWVLSNQKNDATGVVLPQGSVAELAPARNDESILYFSYNEQWQSARAARSYRICFKQPAVCHCRRRGNARSAHSVLNGPEPRPRAVPSLIPGLARRIPTGNLT